MAIALLVFSNAKKHQKNDLQKQLKIGIALPLTGPAASFGEETRRGAEIALDEINNQADNIKVIFEDTSLDSKKAVDAANKLVKIDGVSALVVSAYSEAAATHQIADSANIPTLALWDSNPELEAMGDKVFALGPWTPASGEVTAEFAYKNGASKAAIFGYVQEWSKAVSDAFKDKFIALGGAITAVDFSSPGATDYKTQLTKIVASDPDVIYMTTEDFFLGVKQLKNLGYKKSILTSDLLDNGQIEQSPKLFEGIYGSQVADPESSETSHYIDLYKNKFRESPKKVLYGAWGYDSIHLLYKSYNDSTTKNIINGLYSISYQGASGKIKFNENGSSKTIPKMFVVKNSSITKVDY